MLSIIIIQSTVAVYNSHALQGAVTPVHMLIIRIHNSNYCPLECLFNLGYGITLSEDYGYQ